MAAVAGSALVALLVGGACGGDSAPPKANAEALLQPGEGHHGRRPVGALRADQPGVSRGRDQHHRRARGTWPAPTNCRERSPVTIAGFNANVKVVSKGGVFAAQLPFQSKYTRTNPASFGLTDPSQLLDPDHGLSSLLTAGHRSQGDRPGARRRRAAVRGDLDGARVRRSRSCPTPTRRSR